MTTRHQGIGAARPPDGTDSHPRHPPRRRPHSVYDVGGEPDPRFTLANERTYLAWVRTSLACIAAGVAFAAFVEDVPTAARTVVGIGLVALGILCVVSGHRRWMLNERALRLSEPLPASPLAPLLGAAFVLIGLAIALLLAGLGT
ncbi:MAG: YidH family protein [Dehalococcoidia bacterium]